MENKLQFWAYKNQEGEIVTQRYHDATDINQALADPDCTKIIRPFYAQDIDAAKSAAELLCSPNFITSSHAYRPDGD